MRRIIHCFGIILLFTVLTVCGAVAITGTVKNSAGTGLPGVTVTLANRSDLSAVTNADGSFEISSLAAAVMKKFPDHAGVRLIGTDIELPSDLAGSSVAVALHSLQGRLLFMASAASLPPRTTSFRLPHDFGGMMILSVTLDGSTVNTLVSPLADYYNVKSRFTSMHPAIKSSARIVSSPIDTLIARKPGYRTGKIPIASYTGKNLAITLVNDSLDMQKKGLTIYFIRHAETVANASGETGGGGPTEDHDTLTALGVKQAEDLSAYLTTNSIRPDVIVVSPAWRTQKTIEPFLAAANLTGEIWVELNECCGQEPTGDPLPTERPESRWKMNIEKLSDRFTFRTSEDSYFWWPQSYEEGLFMVGTAHRRLLDNYSQSGKTVMIVGHAVNGGVLLGLLRGYDMLATKPDRPVYLKNTGIHKLTQDTLSGVFTVKQNINNPATE